MQRGDDVLDRLAPADASGWISNWPDVLDRAGTELTVRRVSKRRVVLALAVLVAVLAPLAAIGAVNDWWFLKIGGAERPAEAPVLVKEGQWSGHAWQLVAYPSMTGHLCLSLTPEGSTGSGAALACSRFAGVGGTSTTAAAPGMTITYLSGGASNELPAYVAGPVIEAAASVEIRFGNGTVARTPTFAGPEPLEHVHFYAIAVPADVPAAAPRAETFVTSVAGLDANGDVVACLVPSTAKDGASPLADCR